MFLLKILVEFSKQNHNISHVQNLKNYLTENIIRTIYPHILHEKIRNPVEFKRWHFDNSCIAWITSLFDPLTRQSN